MPICVLLAPEGIGDSTKKELMSKLTSHIRTAYPNAGTEVFLQELDRSHVMVDGVRASEGPAAREVRFCTLICPPGIAADAKKTMMERITADIVKAYPSEGLTWIVHREDDPAAAMLNGSLMSEKYGRGAGR